MKNSLEKNPLPVETEVNPVNSIPCGVLDGITLFRFAHMWKSASLGGVESYLTDLNSLLLQRNKMKIIQTHLTSSEGPHKSEVQHIGQGELVWVPSIAKRNPNIRTSKIQKFWDTLTGYEHRDRICHDLLLETLTSNPPDLAVFHWISADSKIVIDYCNRRIIPILVINHFQNSRLNRRLIRNQLCAVRSVGGVSSLDVPRFIKSRFTNLSDGVDTDFYHPDKASCIERKTKSPLILLASRIQEGKGHLDAVQALSLLLQNGVQAELVFAGVMQNQPLIDNLKRIISDEGLQERVTFLGELSPEELRNWYKASSVVVLPTYSEGLGKVLLEAQAMEKPVIAYDVGGVPEAIQHENTGYLVKIKDTVGLAGRIKELIENPVMRHVMGKRGRQFVIERFSLDSLIDRHEEFYTNVLNLSETSPAGAGGIFGLQA